MANDDLSEEIQLLRKQLEELQKQQEEHKSRVETEIVEEVVVKAPTAKGREDKEPVDANKRTGENGKSTDLEFDLSQDLVDQFRDLLDSIDKDIKDAKPSTLLIVFALGVLVGRL